MTWVDMCEVFAATVKDDGECLMRRRVGPRWGRWGIAYEFIDPELLDVEKNEVLKNGRLIRMGVELDEFRRPVAYHFLEGADTLDGSIRRYGKKHIIIPASEILHGFIHERVKQTRGVPWAAVALYRLRMHHGYEDSALTNATVGAAKMGFYFSEDGAGFKGDDDDTDGELIEEVDPGTFRQLPHGVKLQEWSPEYPRGEFPEFTKAMLRGVASGLGVAYSNLASDPADTSYSSMRHSTLEERDLWKTLQRWMSTELCDPVYRDWLSVQLSAGTVASNGAALPITKFEKYLRCVWRGRRWGWVDPQKDATASNLRIESGSMSVSEVIRETTQEDPYDVFEEIAEERAYMKELGIERKAQPPAQPAKPAEEETEGDEGKESSKED
jgi:lambda family phage portal protein